MSEVIRLVTPPKVETIVEKQPSWDSFTASVPTTPVRFFDPPEPTQAELLANAREIDRQIGASWAV
jgi:hypothetical protein